jgi:Ca2+-binding RTX toxin-like protein
MQLATSATQAGVTVVGRSVGMGTSASPLSGGTGNDVLLGYGGNDWLSGGTGGNDRSPAERGWTRLCSQATSAPTR